MNRDEMLGRVLARDTPWDLVVVGGGATGAGIAVDAASRGYSVLLLEQHDFGKGTSSRSTKLVHGGVRYLARGDISLVREALRERGLMKQNAPHLVHERAFIVPSYSAARSAPCTTAAWSGGVRSARRSAKVRPHSAPVQSRHTCPRADSQVRWSARWRRLLRRSVRRRPPSDQHGDDGGRAGRDGVELRARHGTDWRRGPGA